MKKSAPAMSLWPGTGRFLLISPGHGGSHSIKITEAINIFIDGALTKPKPLTTVSVFNRVSPINPG